MSRYLHRNKRLSGSGIPEISLTPLIDTALTLLIIFMVTSPMINNGIKVDLPEGKVQEVQGMQEDIIVHVDKQKHIYVNGDLVKKDEFITHLKKKIGNQKHKTVFVKGDGEVAYKDVISIVEEVKLVGGIDRVALATKKMA
jgi:biopolymer transport protein TolR